MDSKQQQKFVDDIDRIYDSFQESMHALRKEQDLLMEKALSTIEEARMKHVRKTLADNK
jgi:hypothetical protein